MRALQKHTRYVISKVSCLQWWLFSKVWGRVKMMTRGHRCFLVIQCLAEIISPKYHDKPFGISNLLPIGQHKKHTMLLQSSICRPIVCWNMVRLTHACIWKRTLWSNIIHKKFIWLLVSVIWLYMYCHFCSCSDPCASRYTALSNYPYLHIFGDTLSSQGVSQVIGNHVTCQYWAFHLIHNSTITPARGFYHYTSYTLP